MAEAKVCMKKFTASDYSHRKPRLRALEKGIIDPHRQQFYYGIVNTPITTHLQGKPPSHSYHPRLIHAAIPSYHRRYSPVTEVVLGNKVKCIAPENEFSYNRMVSDVTDVLRLHPPAHAIDSNKTDPWYGRTKTYVTDPSVDDYTVRKSGILAPLERDPQRLEKLRPSSNGQESAGNASWCSQSLSQGKRLS
ncbi:hypothetical protein O6H91_02G015900 [Diphasiastrum complanatum]|uniref:Uncharacterized protein n=1 Tax=Diphasiastrum complanatum TaxID=34168 RepID=A0ACC2ECX1_DIPCM|nr:hypothetical protein O6H91_02G015900 [Diphasiastrum complanatum]